MMKIKHWRASLYFILLILINIAVAQTISCSTNETRLHLSDPPYQNYFYSDCRSSSHVIITSPLPGSNLSVIGPRLLVAWPAGNSGIVTYFAPANGENGTLGIRLENSTKTGQTLDGIYIEAESDGTNDLVGVSGHISFNNSATLTVPILGSIRTIRDFSEGPSILYSSGQNAIKFNETATGGAQLERTWFDNITTTYLIFTPINDSNPITINRDINTTLHFAPGRYQFNASFNYPQLTQLPPTQVLNNASLDLIQQSPDQTTSLSFLSYTTKLLAGTWRFLTYFGRDSMISLLLMQPILSSGENSAIEAVISAVLERINKTDGTVCHEEVLGDYATFLNLQKNITNDTSPQCDYKMIDTDFLLPIVLKNYFVDTDIGTSRWSNFSKTTASFLLDNTNTTYATLSLLTAEKIMRITAPFASPGGQIKQNLIHLNDNELVGEWRDSTYGLGGGRIPYNVNTALVPASLRSIAALSTAGFFPSHPTWHDLASTYAQIWEDATLDFFSIQIPRAEAKALVDNYISTTNSPFPSHTDAINSDISFHALALTLDEINNNQSHIRIMNTDDCFRLFLLNTTNQTQLSAFLDQTASNILNPFPVGLASEVGLFVANPAYGGDEVYARNFTKEGYHGVVVWGWQLAMMGEGLGRQLGRCEGSDGTVLDFCSDQRLYEKVLRAYDYLWTLIENNRAQLSGEVWSWRYENGRFEPEPLGAFVATESNVRQLWSLTFLAVHKENFGGRGK